MTTAHIKKSISKKNRYINKIYRWFPVKNSHLFESMYRKIFNKLSLKESYIRARVEGKSNKKIYQELINKYSFMPIETSRDDNVVISIAKDFLAGAPIWKSPLLQYNVGSATNVAANALYDIGHEINVYNINDGLAGNALAAEKVVCRILSDLAGINPDISSGLFTFGGTGTNLYAIKIGITKAFPKSKKKGLKNKIKIAITEDSHFSHITSLNWLGIGESNAIVMKAEKDRTTNLKMAEIDLRRAFDQGYDVPVIIVNGGTTYDDVIDDIKGFIELRNKLTRDYKLRYKPHIHVDSVIGWSFLFFKKYDFKKNELGIASETLSKLKKQSERIKSISMADSWGVDFHKSVGSCPIPCSVIMVNNSESLASLLQQNEDGDNLHQLAQDFSHVSPVNYTLETSRPGGAPLSAMGALFTMGIKGFQSYLANLVQMATTTRKLIENDSNFNILNADSSGFVTMLQVIPTSLKNSDLLGIQFSDNSQKMSAFIKELNEYNENFFNFDKKSRMDKNNGTEYSFSKGYRKTPSGIKISALKLYPTSPLIKEIHIIKTIETLKEQKRDFDKI